MKAEIKAEDLRKGNLFYDMKGRVWTFSFDDWVNSTEYERQRWRGIPLSPEWLERAGLNKFDSFDNVWEIFYDSSKTHFEISFRADGKWFIQKRRGRNDFPIKICEIEFIHEFQNAIYALTRTEIKFK